MRFENEKISTYHGGGSPKAGNEARKTTTSQELGVLNKQLDRWMSWDTGENDRRYAERMETHTHQGWSSAQLSFRRHQPSTVRVCIRK